MDTRAVRRSWANRKVTHPNDLRPNVYRPHLVRFSDKEITPRIYRVDQFSSRQFRGTIVAKVASG